MQQQKGSMTKKSLSAEEVARELNVKKFLIRFWEKEFKLKLEHAGTGQRGYSQDDLKVFVTIKDLVHNKKMSISQARKQLQETFGDRIKQEDAYVQVPHAVAAAPVSGEATAAAESKDAAAAEPVSVYQEAATGEPTPMSPEVMACEQAPVCQDQDRAAAVSAPVQQEVEVIVPAPAIADEEPCVTDEPINVAPLVQPAVTPVESGQVGKEELFMQNLRIFREQLLNLKQLLDLE
jgi:DNA-binding transcriptional MerR regulator